MSRWKMNDGRLINNIPLMYDRIEELEVVRDTLTERLAVVEAERDYYEALYDAGCNVWNPIFNDMSDKCDALGDSVAELTVERDAAYAELRKQWPAITAVFDREVWNRAALAKEGE